VAGLRKDIAPRMHRDFILGWESGSSVLDCHREAIYGRSLIYRDYYLPIPEMTGAGLEVGGIGVQGC